MCAAKAFINDDSHWNVVTSSVCKYAVALLIFRFASRSSLDLSTNQENYAKLALKLFNVCVHLNNFTAFVCQCPYAFVWMFWILYGEQHKLNTGHILAMFNKAHNELLLQAVSHGTHRLLCFATTAAAAAAAGAPALVYLGNINQSRLEIIYLCLYSISNLCVSLRVCVCRWNAVPLQFSLKPLLYTWHRNSIETFKGKT